MDEDEVRLTLAEAYNAMFLMLKARWDLVGDEELGSVLGDLQLNRDGEPMDPGAWSEWLKAVQHALGGGPPSSQ